MRVQLLQVRLWHAIKINYAEVMNSSSLKSSEHARFILFHVQPQNLVCQRKFFLHACPFTPTPPPLHLSLYFTRFLPICVGQPQKTSEPGAGSICVPVQPWVMQKCVAGDQRVGEAPGRRHELANQE